MLYIRYTICDVPNTHTQIGLIPGTGDPYIQLVITVEVLEPTPRLIICIVLHDAQDVNRDVLEPNLTGGKNSVLKSIDRFLIIEIDDFNVVS